MPTPVELLQRREVRTSVESCRACALVDGCSGPVPFSGTSPNKIAIVGEAPGEHENRQKVPFVGPAGKLLRGYLRHNGMEDVAFVNAVSCYPKRTPTGREVTACAENLVNQLAAISPTHILIVGGVALGAMGVEGRITDWRGNWIRLSGYRERVDERPAYTYALSTWHPSAVLRASDLEPEFRIDIEDFAICAVGGEAPWGKYWCVKCNTYTTLRAGAKGDISRLGMPLCGKCYAVKEGLAGQGRKTGKKEKKKTASQLWQEETGAQK